MYSLIHMLWINMMKNTLSKKIGGYCLENQ